MTGTDAEEIKLISRYAEQEIVFDFFIDMRRTDVADENSREIWEIHSLTRRVEIWEDDSGEAFCKSMMSEVGGIV
jgi:hypothetical protein